MKCPIHFTWEALYSCVPIQRLYPSKAVFEDQMHHSGATKAVPFQSFLQMQSWNAALDYWATKDTTNRSFAAQTNQSGLNADISY